MLTEQNTPLPLVRQWSNLIPHCWESLDELTAKIRATQPSNMAAEADLYAAMSIVQAHVANGSLPVEIVHASFELFCCALWRHSKVVYSFDKSTAVRRMKQHINRQIITIVPLVSLLYKFCGQRIIKTVHNLAVPPKRTAEKFK